jgi:hypothetical protein
LKRWDSISIVSFRLSVLHSLHSGADICCALFGYCSLIFSSEDIFGYELTFVDPNEFYGKLLPEKYMASYHWINVGVSPDRQSRINPLDSIVKKFEEDDLVLVKLDIDQPDIEIPLVLQLVEDETLVKLIDHFYVEHHVHLGELAGPWSNDGGMRGTVKESVELFTKLREKGISAHSWP